MIQSKNSAFKGRLRNTFLSVLLPIVIMLLLTISGTTFLFARNAIQRQINAQLEGNIGRIAIEFEKWVTTKSIRLDSTLQNPTLKSGLQTFLAIPNPNAENWEPLRQIILDKLDSTKTSRGELIFNHFLIIRPDGRIAAASNPNWENINVKNEAFFQNLYQENKSQIFFSPEAFFLDEAFIFTSVPIFNENDEHLATVFGVSGNISIQRILYQFSAANPDLNSYIITDQNEFLGLDPHLNLLTNLPPSPEQREILLPLKSTYIHGAAGSQTYNATLESFNGENSITAYTWLPSLGAGVVAEVPTTVAFRELQSLGPLALVISTLLGGVVIGAITFTTYRLVRPIQELTTVAEQFSQGDWEKRAAIQRNDEIGQLGYAFNQMATDLSALYRSLESQVLERTSSLEKRTRQLEATAQVAREAAAIRNLGELLTYSAELISEHFDFYHTGIFLIDDARQYAILQAANSEGGKRMLARNHRLEVGQTGVVGYVAATGLPRIALDVGEDAYFFNNPDLPNTRSEIALPLQIRNRAIGVLDVQSVESGAFSTQDIEVLQVLADQISVAIENARLLEQSQDAIQELQSAQATQTKAGWRALLRENLTAYYYNRIQVQSATPDQIANIPGEDQPRIRSTDKYHLLSVPILLRAQKIGTISFSKSSTEAPWTENDLSLVQAALAQVAVALDNARLLTETLVRAEQEQMLSNISTQLSRSTDVDGLLRIAARELAKLPNVADAAIQIGPQE